MKQITLKIAPGKPESIGLNGDYVRVKSASVEVRIQEENGLVDATIQEGDALNLRPFTRLLVSHSDAAEQTFILLIGNGTSADGSKVGGSVSVTGDVVARPDQFGGFVASTDLPAGVSVLVRNEETNRIYCAVQNIGSNELWLRFASTASVGNGVLMQPGDMFVFDSCVPTAVIYALSVAGSRLSFVGGYA